MEGSESLRELSTSSARDGKKANRPGRKRQTNGDDRPAWLDVDELDRRTRGLLAKWTREFQRVFGREYQEDDSDYSKVEHWLATDQHDAWCIADLIPEALERMQERGIFPSKISILQRDISAAFVWLEPLTWRRRFTGDGGRPHPRTPRSEVPAWHGGDLWADENRRKDLDPEYAALVCAWLDHGLPVPRDWQKRQPPARKTQ